MIRLPSSDGCRDRPDLTYFIYLSTSELSYTLPAKSISHDAFDLQKAIEKLNGVMICLENI